MTTPFHTLPPTHISPARNDNIADLTILGEIRTLSEGLPPTELIRSLLQQLSLDLASRFIHCFQSTGELLARSRDIYLAIEGHLRHLGDSTHIDWERLGRFAEAIPALERVLLKISTTSGGESASPFPPTDPDAGLGYISRWEDDWEIVHTAVRALSQDKFQLSPELKSSPLNIDHARIQDDAKSLRALDGELRKKSVFVDGLGGGGNRPGNTGLAQDVVLLIEQIMEDLFKRPPSESVAKASVKTLYLVYIPFAMIDDGTTTPEWKEYLKGSNVLSAIRGLLQKVIEHLKPTGPTPPLFDLQKEWDSVAALIRSRNIPELDLSNEMLQLIRLAARVRRPFHGRSVQLIRMLRYLDDQSSKRENNWRMDRIRLKGVMGRTLKTMQTSSQTVTNVRTLSASSDGFTEGETGLVDTLTLIQECYQSFGLETKWPEAQGCYERATKIDHDNIDRLRQRLVGVVLGAQ